MQLVVSHSAQSDEGTKKLMTPLTDASSATEDQFTSHYDPLRQKNTHGPTQFSRDTPCLEFSDKNYDKHIKKAIKEMARTDNVVNELRAAPLHSSWVQVQVWTVSAGVKAFSAGSV